MLLVELRLFLSMGPVHLLVPRGSKRPYKMTTAEMKAEVQRKKKKNVCKRHRKNWRKYISTADVDEYLDKQRQEERIGGPASLKKNEELFSIDVVPNDEVQLEKNLPLTKKQRALLPMTCYKNLEPLTKVPDPITKRNRVRSKFERESVIQKQMREKRIASGKESQRVVQARKDREATLKKKKAEPNGLVFKRDVWVEDSSKPDLAWLGKDALEHNLSKCHLAKVRAPKGIVKGKSILPALELPHPGTSYNPSVTDHRELLKTVAEKELELEKKEAHLNRVTAACFRKVTPEEKQAQWIEEMSQGLVKPEENLDSEIEIKEEKLSDEEDTKENLRLSIGKPSNRLKAKTRKQRRIQRQLREEAMQRKAAKVEKKKISDIYALRKLNAAIENKKKKEQLMAERRKKLAAAHVGRTKRLGAQPFQEPDIDFSRPCELRSRLNLVKKQGNLLADRYISLQKRNMLPPGSRQLKSKKAKVKRFTKASHKTDDSVETKRPTKGNRKAKQK